MIRRHVLTVAVLGASSAAAAWAQDRTAPQTPAAGRSPAAQPDATETPATPGNQPGLSPSGTSGTALPPTSGTGVNPGLNPASGTTGQMPAFVRATQIVGFEVRDSTGQTRLGQIADVLLTPHTMGGLSPTGAGTAPGGLNPADATGGGAGVSSSAGATGASPTGDAGSISANATASGNAALGGHGDSYALIQVDSSASGRVVVVPWGLLQFYGSYFVLGMEQSRLNEAPSVMQDDPRILQNANWLQGVGTFYGPEMQRMQRMQARPEALTPEPAPDATPNVTPGARPSTNPNAMTPNAAPAPRRSGTPGAGARGADRANRGATPAPQPVPRSN